MVGRLFRHCDSAWVNLSLRWKGIFVVLILPITIVTAVVVLTRISVIQNAKIGAVVATTLQKRTEIAQSRTLILRAEAGVRGYAIAGEEPFLADYRDIERQSEGGIQRLRGLVGNNATEAQHVRSIRSLTLETLNAMAAVLEDARTKRAGLTSVLDRERVSMDRLQAEYSQLQAEEDHQLVAWATEAKRRGIVSFLGVVLAVVLGILGAIAAIMLFTSGVVRRVEELQKNAARVAEGQPVTLAVASHDEIGLLESALRRTSELLRERDERLAESQAAYTNQNALLESILTRMGDGVIVVDGQREILVYNPAAEQIMGIAPTRSTPENWVAQNGLLKPDMVTPHPFDELPLARAMRGEIVDSAEVFVRNEKRPNGIWVQATARPLLGGEGASRGAILVFRDVTAIKAAESELRKAKEQAEEANRAKNEFLSRMSHELRTPLNAVLGFAQVLEMDPLTDDQQASVAQILKGGRHLLNLINEVLDIARIEAGRLTLSPEPILLHEALDEAIDLVTPLAAKARVKLMRNLSPFWNQCVQADRQRLKQVILNLLSNAIKYNHEGGSVTVGCTAGDGDRLRVEVSDTGRGIPEQKMALLFSPFERLGADETGVEGTGVGLALSKKLTEVMGGRIGVVSQFGQGSRFWVEFPRIESQMERYERHEDAPPATAAPHKAATILYVEDNLSNSTLMERILANRPGIKLVSAMQGRLGLDLAREHSPDLILLDVHLPDMNGDVVLRLLREDERTRDIPVAMVSADATPGQVERLKLAGAQAYLTKPIDVKELLAFVDGTLKQLAHQPA